MLNKKAMSMVGIFIMLSVLSIFAYTLIDIMDKQLEIREDSKRNTDMYYFALSALYNVIDELKSSPDKLVNVASVYSSASVYFYSSKALGYIPSDVIGTFYSYKDPGKFKFSVNDNSKVLIIKLSEVYKAYVVGVTHEENAGVELKIYSSEDGIAYDEIYSVGNKDFDYIDKTGSEVFLEFDSGKDLRYLKFDYGAMNGRNKYIDEIYVYDKLISGDEEIKTDLSDDLHKYIYSYKLFGNKIYITARYITRLTPNEKWNIVGSYSLEAKFYVDSGGNIVIIKKNQSEKILPFPDKFK
jgi:hypothetical protein